MTTYPLSSINGDIKWNGTQVPHARGWNISINNNPKTYATNQTKGKIGRRPGNQDITGSFTIYTATGDIAMLPGQIAPLLLYCDATDHWTITNAIIISTELVVNMESGDIEGVTVNWGFAGNTDSTGGSVTAPNGTTIDSSIVGP